MNARDAAIQAVKDHPATTFMAPYESLADAVLAAATPLIRAEVLREAAAFVGNDDECGCGGCDTCVPRKLAGGLLEMADAVNASATELLVVSRYDVAMEPAPEEEPVLTVGAIAEDGRPVALLFDAETRAKVAGWLAPTEAAELKRLRAFASATERRHNEIRARLAMVDIRDSAEAWDLGMAIVAILDGPLHPDTDEARPTPDATELLAHARAFEFPWPGHPQPLWVQRSHAGGDRWMICDREGRRWHRELGFVYERQDLHERDRTDTRFPFAEAWPLAHRIAAGEPMARATDTDGTS